MTSIEIENARAAPPQTLAVKRLLIGTFAATLFLSAFLLFSVQPMFTKMVLPVLGGSPGVWSVAMVFFQGLLLAGYLWAHLLTRYLPLRFAAMMHLALTASAVLALPLALRAGSAEPPAHGEAFWLIGVFAAAVGLPFFALSANGPLLQAWFARSGHPRAHEAYTLYGASNAGSFGALIAYPFAAEPLFGLSAQSQAWTAAFVVLIGCLVACGWLALRGAPATQVKAHEAHDVASWTWRRFASWAFAAAVPAGLLVAVTAHISTDIASAPLLWVLPLSLYLLTFVIAFRSGFVVADKRLAPMQIGIAIAALVFLLVDGMNPIAALALHLAFFFVSALLCHRALYGIRPGHRDLTAFYLAMSLGGLIGGVFAGLIAPNVFSSVAEYPLLLAACLLCQPQIVAAVRRMPKGQLVLPLAAIPLAYFTAGKLFPPGQAIALCGALLLCLSILRWRSLAQHFATTFALCIIVAWLPQALMHAQSWRSFYGVHKVREKVHMGHRFRILLHGATMHGAVRIDDEGIPAPAGHPVPATYYADGGPIAEALAAVRARRGALPSIYAIGLGVGTLSCQRKPGEAITFFEIDSEVIRIARDPQLFSFVSSCAPDARIVAGDARLTLARESGRADIIIVDAFSSDAIPVHLLTFEAMAVYLSRLAPDGVLVFHISNQVMELSPTIARIAADHGLTAWARTDLVRDGLDAQMHASSRAMVLARGPAQIGELATNSEWKKITPDLNRRPWTDDYSTILQPILDRRSKLVSSDRTAN